MTMTLDTPAPDVIVEEPGSRRTGHLRRVARPALGLLLPLGLALAWELAVRFGYSNGRIC